MTVEFYHRNQERLSDRAVHALIIDDLAATGHVVDRLRDVKAKRFGPAYWRYEIAVRRVTE